MKDLQKMGGYAALIEAVTYVIGLALAFTVLADYGMGDLDSSETVTFIADNHAVLYIWHLLIYVVNGIFLVVLVQALYERLKAGSPAMAQTAAAFGFIWAGLVIGSGMLILVDLGTIVDLYGENPADAELAWVTLDSVEKGLGGGIEIVGGLWVLLLSWAALRGGSLPAALNYLGVVIGVAGILTIIPPLEAVGAIFGLGFIVWFFWAGIVLLRDDLTAA